MAINKKLISFATQAQFDANLANNNIDHRSIVFIEDKKRIWTHGVFFDTSWDFVTGKPNTYTPSAHTLGSHSDVTLASLANGNILRYNGSRWVNNTLAQAGIATQSDIDTAIDGIEIGGRNLVLNTKTPFTGVSNDGSFGLIKENAYLFSNSLIVGETYTISFLAKATGSNRNFQPYISGSQPMGSFILSSDYAFYKNTFVCLYSYKNIHFYGVGVSTIDVKDFKIEKGTKATDWTPAPEDQVSDWNTTDVSSFSYIKNKPSTFAPDAHTHGPITNDGKIGTLTNRIIETTTGGLLTHVAKNTAYNKNFGTASGTVAQGNDSRINNGQTAFTRTTNAGITGAHLSNITELDTPPVGARFISSTPSTHSSYPAGMTYPMGIEVGRSAAVSVQLVIGHSNSGTNGNMAFRSKSGASMAPWRSVWDNVNLTKLTQLTNDLPNFTRTVAGLVPAPGAATTTRYLREDGTWVIPPNTGDTHWVTGVYVGAVTTKTDTAATNPYIKIFDNDTNRGNVQIIGGTNVTVSSNGSKAITINSSYTDTTYTTGTLAQLNAGTDTTGRLQTAKLLNDWLNPKLDNKFDKTGGTLTGSTYNMLELKRSSTNGSSVLFSNSSGNLGKIGFTSNGSLIIGTGASTDGVANMLSITPAGVSTFYNSITAPTFVGALSGNASSATYASTVTLTADNSSNASRFILFSDAATGNQRAKTDTGLKYNPSSNTITATTFSGNATNATNSDKLAGIEGSKYVYGSSTATAVTVQSDLTQAYRAGFYAANGTTTGYPSTSGDTTAIILPYSGAHSSYRYGVRIGGWSDIYHQLANGDGVGTWYKIWSEKNFKPEDYSLKTHNHTLKLVAGTSTATTNSTADVADPYIRLFSDNVHQGNIRIVGGTNVGVVSKNGEITFTSTNTTYSAGTLALLQTGTNTSNRVWSAKILNDWLNGKGYATQAEVKDVGIYNYTTSVSDTVHTVLQTPSGSPVTLTAPSTQYVYDINLQVTSTGTVTGARQAVYYDGIWKVFDISSVTKSSNNPYIEIIDGLPKVRTKHASNYTVALEIRRHYAPNSNINFMRYMGLDYVAEHTHTFASITNKPTTLSGYGITDAVTLNTTQTITGVKTFTGNVTAPTFIGALTGNADSATTSNRLNVPDTRSVDSPPSSIPRATITAFFKKNDIVNAPPVTTGSTFAHILNMNGYTSGNSGSGGHTTQLAFGDSLAIRQSTSTTAWGAWTRLALVTDNVASATKLQTARTIWGQSFNGIGNVSGAITGATTGNFSGNVTAPTFIGALAGNASSASSIGGLGKENLAKEVHYGTTSSPAGYYKVKILPATSWMASFTIRVYQGYNMYDITISGYNYAGNYWHSPKATLSNSSVESIPISFGYDSAYNLWVAFPASSYAGITVINANNGYIQVADFGSKFTIIHETALTGTVQTTITANTNIPGNAATAATATTATNLNRSVVAGNGLSGGGVLNADRTLTLGTPSTLTAASTNTVTATSHTHAISTTSGGAASTIVQTNGNGAIGASRYGFYGVYNSAQTQSIWSMGSQYGVNATTTSLGNLYGLAYSYISVGGSSVASQHQIHFVNNGVAQVSVSLTSATVKASTFIGALSGNASSATYASAVTLTADNSSNATRYPLFASAATGNLSPRTDTGFTYNPSTGALTSTSFVGNLTGLASLNLPLTGGTLSGPLSVPRLNIDTSWNIENVTTGLMFRHESIGLMKIDWLDSKVDIYGALIVTDFINAPGYYQTSDIRLKNVIKPLTVKVEDILNIPSFYFEYEDKKGINIGTSAQEVQKVFPEIVNTDSKGMLSVEYDKFGLIALDLIKTQQKEIDSLKYELNNLKLKIDGYRS